MMEFEISKTEKGKIEAIYNGKKKVCNNAVEVGLFQLQCFRKEGNYKSLQSINDDIDAYELVLKQNRVDEYFEVRKEHCHELTPVRFVVSKMIQLQGWMIEWILTMIYINEAMKHRFHNLPRFNNALFRHFRCQVLTVERVLKTL